MIKASVLIPMFRAKHIAWLTMEGWCRQRDVDFEWELIIAEETKHEGFGRKNVIAYRERLRDVGCVSLKYISLKHWIPLGAKWKLLFEKMSDSSVLSFRHAADIFASPRELVTLCSLYEEHPSYDWFVPLSSIIYSVEMDRAVVADPEATLVMNPPKTDIAGIAIAADLMRKALHYIPSIRKNLDGETWRAVRKVKPNLRAMQDRSDMWRYGVSAHGFGNISVREHIFNNIYTNEKYYPLIPCPFDIRETIPEDILDRLKECSKYLPLYVKKKQWPSE